MKQQQEKPRENSAETNPNSVRQFDTQHGG